MRPTAVPREVQLMLPPGTEEPRPDGTGTEQRAGRKTEAGRDHCTSHAMSPEKSEQRQRYDGLLSEQAKTKNGQRPKGRSSTTAVKAVYSPPTADDDGTTPRLGTAIDGADTPTTKTRRRRWRYDSGEYDDDDGHTMAPATTNDTIAVNTTTMTMTTTTTTTTSTTTKSTKQQ